MLEILLNFEQIAKLFDPKFLIGLGLAAVLAGLFLWIGGLGFRKILAAILGMVSGGICGLFIIGHNIIAVALAAITAVIAVIFEKVFILILAAALAAVSGLVILAGPHIENSGVAISLNQDKVSEQSSTISFGESLKTVKMYAVDCVGKIKQASLNMPVHNWPIIVVLAVIPILAGLYIDRLAPAFCCAALGTILLFAGMILLLLYKGSTPITRIHKGSSFYLVVFTAMIVFGTFEQLLLCKSQKRKPTRKNQANKDQQEPDKTAKTWRTT